MNKIEKLAYRNLQENGWGLDSHLSGTELAIQDLRIKVNEIVDILNHLFIEKCELWEDEK